MKAAAPADRRGWTTPRHKIRQAIYLLRDLERTLQEAGPPTRVSTALTEAIELLVDGVRAEHARTQALIDPPNPGGAP